MEKKNRKQLFSTIIQYKGQIGLRTIHRTGYRYDYDRSKQTNPRCFYRASNYNDLQCKKKKEVEVAGAHKYLGRHRYLYTSDSVRGASW